MPRTAPLAIAVLLSLPLALAACGGSAGTAATGSGDAGASPAGASPAVASLAPAGKVLTKDVKVGDCANDPLDKGNPEIKAGIRAVKVVPCSQEHDSEVYATISLPGEAFPGDAKVIELGEPRCSNEFAAFVGRDFQDSTLTGDALYPSKDTWADSDHTVVCFVGPPKGTMITGTLKGAKK